MHIGGGMFARILTSASLQARDSESAYAQGMCVHTDTQGEVVSRCLREMEAPGTDF